MEEAIRVKSAISTLSDDEFWNFMRLYDKEQIGTMIFDHFIYQLQNAQNISHLNHIIPAMQQMNETISEIIRSRDKITEPEDVNDDEPMNQESENIRFDDMPSIIISSISSFLEFSDILSLEKCNRSIFVGSRSPPSLQLIPLSYSSKLIKHCKNHKNSIYHWNRFKSIKQFELEISDCFEFEDEQETLEINAGKTYRLNHMPFWKHLKNLYISDKAKEEYDVDESTEYIVNLSNNLKLFNLSNLERVRIADYINPDIIFNNAPLLKYVTFEYLPDHRWIDPNDIKWPQQLNGIVIERDDLETELATNIYGELQSLHTPRYDPFPTECKVDGLHEVCLVADSLKIDLLNVQKFIHLQRINITWKFGLSAGQKSIESLLSLTTLKYIGIQTKRSRIDGLIFETLRNAMNKYERELIRISIKLEKWKDDEVDLIAFNKLLELINTMNKQTADFVLQCNSYNKLLNSKWSEKDNFFMEENKTNSDDEEGFIICNKNCKIHGYKEQWLMVCPRCQ